MSRSTELLPQRFFARDAVVVAEQLIGKRLRRGRVVLRITETEAYPPADSASHCRAGRTRRNAPMWGPPGHAYVYLCYGLHQLLNVVTNRDGEGAAVLIRSCEIEAGAGTVRARRRGLDGPVLLTGPGKVGAALAVDGSVSGAPLYQRGGLSLLDGPPPDRLLVGPRVGIGFADAGDIAAPWRFAAGDTRWVSVRHTLVPHR